ncbi:MAG: glycogen-binding domain-containing protein [bacterium]|nr:glycogen-binding domain-containing protein [bacterium]
MKRISVLILIFIMVIFTSSTITNIIKRRLPPPQLQEEGVLFSYEAPYAKTVSVAGDWNSWGGTSSASGRYDPNIGKMTDADEDGVWEVLIPYSEISPGRHQYKVVIDSNTWVLDPNNFETSTEGGFTNSLIIIPEKPGRE